MSHALGSLRASAQSPLILTPTAAALLGLAPRATLADWLDTLADGERNRIDEAAARALAGPLPVVLATRLRMRAGDMAAALLELRAAGDALALVLLDVDPSRATATVPDAAARLALRTPTDGTDLPWEWDLDAELPQIAAELRPRLGYPARASDAALAALIHADDAAALTHTRRRHLDNGAPFALQLRLRAADGSYRSFHFAGAARVDESGVLQHLSGTTREIEVDERTQARLAQQDAEIERLGRESSELAIRLIDAQETERRHIARELHDQTGQTLTAAVLDLEFWKEKGVPPDEVGAVLAHVKQALSEIRNISLQLRPPMLDEAGLEAAVRVYLDRQAASGKFDVSFAVEGAGRLAPQIELTAFRLVQEAVTNIVRHAGARHVDVSLRIGTHELTLRVSDNGSGCIAQDALGSASSGMSLGLISLRERAALVGGHCEFISAPALGSMVLARLPLRR